MANLRKPLDQRALDALTLSTEEARAAYENQRQTLKVERTIRQERKLADLPKTDSAAPAGKIKEI
jgi:hypothetical protein